MNHPYLIMLSLVLALSLFACSSEKSQQPETVQQHRGSETAAVNQAESGTQEASSPSSVQPETAKEESTMAEKNNLPTVDSAKIQLEGNRFRIIAKGSDKDGDPVTLSYEWEINGKSAGAGDTISGFKRGDKLAVKITPYDGKEYGMAKILTTEIRNTPPTIVEHREVKFDGKVWSYQVKATDADGDPLTYSLKSAPQGMTIDAKSGLIKWEVPPEFVGKASVTVSVTDGQGGESTYTFDAIISVEPKK